MQRYISPLLIGLIVFFALSSFGNVTEYIHKFHNAWTGWTLGACFSVTVVVCAYIAAKRKDRAARWSALTVGLVFGLASAWFQTRVYLDGGAPTFEAVALSFLPIVFGEVGLAMVEFYYSRNTDGSELDEAQRQLDAIRNQLDEVQRLADDRQNQFDQSRNELVELRTKFNRLQKEFDDFTPESILRRLDDTKRQKMADLLRMVDGERVEAPGDLIRLGMSKSDAYALWPIAMAAKLVYPNGDDSYHVRGLL